MAATKTVLMGGGFQDGEGNPLSLGYLKMKLSQDASVSGVGNICSGLEITIQLDVNGNVVTSPAQSVWANTGGVLAPINTFYKVTGYTAAGQRAWGQNNQQVAAGATFNLGSWVPNQVIQWFPTVGATPLAVEVRGATFSSTTLLNFESSDSSITITDEGSGLLNFQGSSSSLSLEVDGTPITAQNPVNFESGSGIAITNPSAGNILITNSAPGAAFSGAGAGQFAGPGLTLAPMAQNLAGVQLPGNGTTYVYKFVLDSAWTLTSCTLMWTNNLNGVISFALYTSSGAKISNTDNFMATDGSNPAYTPVQNTFAATVLPAGVYYFAYASSGGSGLVVPGCALQFTSTSGTAFLGMVNQTGVFIGTAANSRIGNAMPSTLGALTGASVGIVMPTPIWAT